MLRLRRLSLQNWFRVRAADLEFPEFGLVLVLGQNHTATARLDSVGAGKTALGEAINAAVFGPRNDMVGYSLDEAGSTLVTLVSDLADRELVVETGYRHAAFPTASGEGLRFTLAGSPPVERPRVKQTRQELTELVGLPADAAPWTVFLDGERLRFNRLSQAEALELLMQALGQPPWQVYHERAREAAGTASRACAEALAVQTAGATQLAETERLVAERTAQLAETEQALATAQAEHGRRRGELQAQVAAVAETLRTAVAHHDATALKIKAVQEADAARFGQLSLTLNRLESERATATRYTREWTATTTATAAELRYAQQQARAADKKVCPTCHRPIDPGVEDIEIARLATAKVAELTQRLGDEQVKQGTCETSLREIEAEIKTTRQQQAQLHSAELAPLSNELVEAERRTRQLDQQLRALEARLGSLQPPADTAVVTARARLDECVNRRDELCRRASVDAARLAAAERTERVATYWARGFSPEGIPNLVLQQTVGPLNEAARLISEALSGGTIQVQFEASTELADGRRKPRLVTRVTNRFGARRLSGNSKGEAGLANLIIAETQTQVGRVTHRVGYRWFDEVVNTQDPSVRRSFYSYLRRQAHERRLLIFVVDHHADAASFADRTLIAEKSSDGFTRYLWA